MPVVPSTKPRAGRRLPRFFYARLHAFLLASILLGVALLAPLAHGEVYRWVDTQGRVHFGDKPPNKEAAESIAIKAQPKSATSAPTEEARRDKQQRLLRAWKEERLQREEKAAKNREAQELREKNCHIAKDQLRTYRNASSLYDLDKNGNRRILSDAEYKTALNEAEEEVARWCG